MKRFSKFIQESYELEEAVTVKKKDYSWGKMMTVHHGSSHSFPLHPEHQEKIRKLESGQKTTFKDETGANITAHRDGDTIHLKHPNVNKMTAVARKHFTESVDLDEARKSSAYQFTHKPGDPESEKKLADLKASVKGTGKRVVLQGRLGKNNPNAHKYSKDAPRAKYVNGKRVNSDVSGKSGAHSHQRIQKADAAHHDVYVYDRNESVELDEAVEVSHDRYMRSHGKKASGVGGWFFTHKNGSVNNIDDPKEVHFKQGKFSDAKKSAQQWAKKHGHSTVYVMEEVEQIDEISDEKKKEYIRAVADKGGIFRKPRPGSLAGFDRRKEKALVKAFKGGSMQDYVKLHKKSEKRAGIAHKALDSLKKEEVELDEVSDKKLDAYRQKAFADQPAGDDGSDKYRKRKFGRDLAFAKQTGRAKVLATKEEVEQIDELSPKTLGSYVKKASADQYYRGKNVQYHDTKAQKADGPFAKETKRKHYAKASDAERKAANRDTGIGRAVDRLTRESADVNEASKEHLERLKSMLDKAKPGSADHSQIRHAISSMYGAKHIPEKHRNVKPDTYDY